MGEKLFPALLENLREEVRGKSVIDILNKLAELELLSKSNDLITNTHPIYPKIN